MSGLEDSPPARRVYVVDDDEAFRGSLTMLLQSDGWSVEGFASAAEFSARAGELEPGVLLLDLHLEDASGLDLLEHKPLDIDRFAVVMVTGAGEIQTAVRSIKAGAVDFIEKPFEAAPMLARLAGIEKEFTQSLEAREARWDAVRRTEALSPRERDVLERLLSGAPNKLIARDLGLSPRTVEMHRARMLQKLGVGTTAEALEVGRMAGVDAVPPSAQST